jgi:hypothetical protein
MGPLAPDELYASLKLTVAGELDQPASVDVYGALLGIESDAAELLDDLVVRAGADPISASAKQLSFAETRRFWAELPVGEDGTGHGPHAPSAQHPYLVAKSEFFKRLLPTEAVAALLENLLHGRPAGQFRELDFSPWGGAYNRMPPAATAFVHRDALFQLKHAVVVDPQASTDATRAAHRWVRRSWALVHRWGRVGCSRTLPIRTWRAGRAPTTGATTTVWYRSRPATTQRASSTLTSRSLLGEACCRQEPTTSARGRKHRGGQTWTTTPSSRRCSAPW